MMRKRTIKLGLARPANSYAGNHERIYEFMGPSGLGGLISVSDKGDGTLFIHAYRLDEGVLVTVDPGRERKP